MRAQTTLDFAIGISIFLVVVVYVLAFVPGMLQPFVESQEENTIVADRAADQLTQSMLGSPETPFVLETDCTVAFFGGPAPGDCRFDTGQSVKERLGLVGNPAGTGPNLQVEIRGNVSLANADGDDTVCWDAGGDRLVEDDDSACGDNADDTVFEIGNDPPTQREGVVVSRRVVSIDNSTANVFVRVW